MIYFIQDETGSIKIGFTSTGDPDARKALLQTGSSSELVLISSIPGSQSDEQNLHARFSASRVRGEWFKPTPDLIKYIAQTYAGSPFNRQAAKTVSAKLLAAFNKLAEKEPRLIWLLNRAQRFQDDPNPNFCANSVWYGYQARRGLKDDLSALVGWTCRSGDKELSGSHAYDVAYDRIYEELPDCRGNCACSSVMNALMG